MRSHLKSWDQDYRVRGCLCAGSVKDMPELPQDSIVLELGRGNGKTLSAMLDQPWRIVPLDVSLEAVKLSRTLVVDRAALLAADASRLPFQDAAFDAVFAFHILGHTILPAREIVASEAFRVLKDKGMLFLRDFEQSDMPFGMGDELEPKTYRRGQGVVTHYFTETEAKSLFIS